MERSGTVDKAIRVLEALHSASGPLALAELAVRVDMPKATLHRLLASLLSHELVEQDAEARYALGVGLVRLGLGALNLDPVVRLARPELERAAANFGETFFLVSARAGKLVVLEKVEGTGFLRAAPSIGSEVPVSSTASGRLYLGLAPDALRAEQRAVDRECRALVQRAVRQGYDLNRGEWIAGLIVVAAPIFVAGRMHGTVACAAAAAQLDETRLNEAIRRTRLVAERVSQSFVGRREETS